MTYTCIDMYILSGTGPFMCLASKMWDTPPICLGRCCISKFFQIKKNSSITYSTYPIIVQCLIVLVGIESIANGG